MNIENGSVIVFSDAHFYPDTETTAYLALLECIKEFKPEAIVANGDIFDGTSISRYPRIMFSEMPSVVDELNAVTHYMNEIETASTFKSNLIHTLGNHDARFESFLSANVPQYQNIAGFSLRDHLPLWQPCWSFWINDETVIKHRHKGGAYAGYNNIKAAMGANVITGHTHVLAVQPITGYQKTFYGVQTGTLANPHGNQFVDYTEDNPLDWRSGFVMLTFKQGRLLMPEIIQVFDENEGKVEFRGKVHSV
jgi:predicted phosphodiesterase